MAQGTAQIAASAAAAANSQQKDGATAAATTSAAPPDANEPATAATAATAAAAAATAASLESLFAADGHAFDSAAASPHRPIAVTGVDITAPCVLRSADDLATPYTNYTSGYKALLDYVW